MRRADRVLALVQGLLLAGCASAPPTAPAPSTMTDPQAALAQLAIGRSTRAEVLARLGPGEALALPGGREVRAWRTRDRAGTLTGEELVLLFGPDGVLRQARARPADVPPAR